MKKGFWRNSVLMLLTVMGLGGHALASNASITLSSTGAPVSGPGSITVAFSDSSGHTYSETVPYGQYSSPASLASWFAAKFTSGYLCPAVGNCTGGLGAHADGAVITFQLNNGAIFGEPTITNPSSPFSFNLSAWPTMPTINLTSSGSPTAYGGSVTFTATVPPGETNLVTFYNNGTSLGTATPANGTATLTTSNLPVGSDSITATIAAGGDYYAATSRAIIQAVNQATPTISINDIPSSAVYGGSFTVTYSYSGNGSPAESVSSSTPSVCAVLGYIVNFVGVGTCTLQASATATWDYAAVTGNAQSFTVNPATPTISIGNIPSSATFGSSFTVAYSYSGNGSPTKSVLSSTTSVCTVSGNTVNFVGVGTCSLTASASTTTDYSQVTGSAQQFHVGAVPAPGMIDTIAGNGTPGYNGDGELATSAELWAPNGLAIDGAGNIYIADSANHRIRKVTASTGNISTVAGNGTAGYSGDGGAAISAELNAPTGVAVDSTGNIFIADEENQRIRKVTASTGNISTVAGNGTAGYSGDGGAAISAELAYPSGVSVDNAGNIYIADVNNDKIRKVTASTGNISTVAGHGTDGYSGDGGAAINAQLFHPVGVAVDSTGNIYIADLYNERIRKVTASTGNISTVAGNGTAGFSGDGGAATSAELYWPYGIAVDNAGNLYIVDANNDRVRKVTASTGNIFTVAGNGTVGYSGDGGAAISAELYAPRGVALDSAGNIYLSDMDNNRVRAVGVPLYPTTLSISCLPGTINYRSSATCTATVTGSSPTGTVALTYNMNGTTNVNYWTSCTLASGSCSVSGLSNITPGSYIINGTYSGDGNNDAAIGSSSLYIMGAANITSVSPTSGSVGLFVGVSGIYFGDTIGSSTVTFNGTIATPSSWSNTLIDVPVPPGATSGPVVVTVSGVASNGVNFTVTVFGAPSISSISPTSGPVDSAITISGNNFGATQGSSSVTLSGTTMPIISWSATNVIAQVPVGATSGNVVANVGGVASNGMGFTVLPVPGITSMSPSLGPVGTSVTITGANFGATQGTSAVAFNGTTATPTSWSGTQIVAPVPTGASTGPVIVIVSGVASNGPTFTVAAGPSITSLSPRSGAIGTSVGVSGGNFGTTQGTSTITFNGVTATPTSWNVSQLIAPVPNGATTGNVAVTVMGAQSNGVNFTVTTAAPTIASLSPMSGTIGTSVTIIGTNFGAPQGTSLLTFNGMVATPTSWGSTQIVAPVPNGATTGDVVVTVLGLPSNHVSFTVAAAPSISALSPQLGAVGTSVTVTGLNFGSTQGTSTLTFNGTSATPTIWNATGISAPVPSGATSGPVVVTVGGVASNGIGFTVTSQPYISSISPTSGAPGTQVTISGVNFGSSQGTSTITFNGTVGTAKSWTNTQIVTLVPAGGRTGNIVVTVNGKSSNGVNFAVSGSAPTIIHISPSSGYVGSTVSIFGSGFGATQGSSIVTFNGASANVNSWADTLISAVVPPSASNGPVVVILANGLVSNNNVDFALITSTGQSGLYTVIDAAFGFDVNQEAPLPTMQAGWNYSPFYDVGVYLGGICYGSGAPGQNWTGPVQDMGWGILPIYVGYQPASTQSPCSHKYPNGDGTSAGVNDAQQASQLAQTYGMPLSIVYADIEQYTGPDSTVQNYIEAWVSTLHQAGFLAGVYFSGSNWPDINSTTLTGNAPDAIWVAAYKYTNTASDAAEQYMFSAPLYGLSGTGWSVPDYIYTNSRVHQFVENVSTNPNASKFDDSAGEDLCDYFYGGQPCNPYAVFGPYTLNGTYGIDWDVEIAPVVPWSANNYYRLLPAPNALGPDGDEYGPDDDILLAWEDVPALYLYYEVVVTDEYGDTVIDDYVDAGTTEYFIFGGYLDPGVTYYWTVGEGGGYKEGDWSDGGWFGVDYCDPFLGCGGVF